MKVDPDPDRLELVGAYIADLNTDDAAWMLLYLSHLHSTHMQLLKQKTRTKSILSLKLQTPISLYHQLNLVSMAILAHKITYGLTENWFHGIRERIVDGVSIPVSLRVQIHGTDGERVLNFNLPPVRSLQRRTFPQILSRKLKIIVRTCVLASLPPIIHP